MKKELTKPTTVDEAVMEVENEAVVAYNGNTECGWGLICGSEW